MYSLSLGLENVCITRGNSSAVLDFGRTTPRRTWAAGPTSKTRPYRTASVTAHSMSTADFLGRSEAADDENDLDNHGEEDEESGAEGVNLMDESAGDDSSEEDDEGSEAEREVAQGPFQYSFIRLVQGIDAVASIPAPHRG